MHTWLWASCVCFDSLTAHNGGRFSAALDTQWGSCGTGCLQGCGKAACRWRTAGGLRDRQQRLQVTCLGAVQQGRGQLGAPALWSQQSPQGRLLPRLEVDVQRHAARADAVRCCATARCVTTARPAVPPSGCRRCRADGSSGCFGVGCAECHGIDAVIHLLWPGSPVSSLRVPRPTHPAYETTDWTHSRGPAACRRRQRRSLR